MRLRKILRWAVRLSVLCLATVLAFGGPLPVWLSGAVPALSPLSRFSVWVAQRFWIQGILAALPALLILAMAVMRGRWFCRWLCPTGALLDIPSVWGFRKTITRRRFGGYIFWTIAFSSIIGAPLFLFLDPLSAFNRQVVVSRLLWENGLNVVHILTGVFFPLFLLVSLVHPMFWCVNLCPMGYMFDLFRSARNRFRMKPDRLRRDILVGAAVGIPLAALVKTTGWLGARAEELPLLPPGALAPLDFAAACKRCYACVGVCPTGILHIAYFKGRGLSQMFQPEMDPDRGGCRESCNACTRVCPTGAIGFLSESDKRLRRIGMAEVRRDACLAWADRHYCMVCYDYCPYNAIRQVMGDDAVPQPVVVEELCRGCGYCQNRCPATRDGKAIVVRPVPEQSVVSEKRA